MKLADYVIEFLAKKGIHKVFVVYGAANGDLIDAFTRRKDIEYVAVMHEQAGGFAAEGYAKITGRPGCSIVTSGPGGMNLLTPMGNCFYDSIPCIFITGQINSQFLRSDPSIRQVGFQECDIVSMATPVTKYAKMITDAKSIRYELEKAYFLSTSGRPGPILLDIPLNIQKIQVEHEEMEGFNEETERASYDLRTIDAQTSLFLTDLFTAKRPCILVGGGVRLADAVEEIRELGRLLKLPIFPTWNALDIISSDYEYYGGRVGTYGGAGRNFGIQNSDLLLCVGTRLSGRITGGNIHTFARSAKKYVVDVDKALLQRRLQQVPFDENVFCDAKIFLQALINKIKRWDTGEVHYNFSSWFEQVKEWRDKYDPVKPEFFEQKVNVHPYAFLRTLSRLMDEDAILVGDCGGNIVASNHAFETKKRQRNITNNGNSPMGFSFAGAIGCWFAAPERQVVCTIGDGGFNMNIQELQTLVNYGVKLKTFIINNHIYGITKAYQETNFNGRAEACGPKGYTPPNFIDVCNAYKIKTFVINNHLEMEDRIKEVLSYDGPVVVSVECPEYHTYEPRIFGWKTPIEDMYPYLPREEFRKNMIVEPIKDWENPAYPDIINK